VIVVLSHSFFVPRWDLVLEPVCICSVYRLLNDDLVAWNEDLYDGSCCVMSGSRLLGSRVGSRYACGLFRRRGCRLRCLTPARFWCAFELDSLFFSLFFLAPAMPVLFFLPCAGDFPIFSFP